METVLPTFGPELHNAKLFIDAPQINIDRTLLCIDIETDERDNFVGAAVTNDGREIYYFTDLKTLSNFLLPTERLVGHNLKGDMKWMINWGVNLKSSQLYYDTCLASYIQNTTKESHGLKDLAKEILGIEWPTYKQMIHPDPEHPKKKVTLDQQDVERVARYCGMDCLATYRLWQHFEKSMKESEKRYLQEIELPTARVLLDMELKGVQVDVKYLQALNATFELNMLKLVEKVTNNWKANNFKEDFNINSNKQVAQLLQSEGAILPVTQKGNFKVDKATLEQWKFLPVVLLLLEYSKIEKLKSTYTEALLEKQKNGRIYCNFNQISKDAHGNSYGISTGRLSSSNPNLQNIPTRTEEGALLRKAFTAGINKVFIDADFSQIEPRLVAHFTKDKTFIEAYRNGRDLYQELVEGTGRSRQDGKTFMLALLYGAQPKKLSSVFKCSEQEAQKIVETIMRRLSGVTAWINRIKYEAHQKSGVKTLFGRWIPLPKINNKDRYERMHWERVAVNSIIQGSAAEIMKKSLIALNEAGYSTVLNVHDEVLIETNEETADLEQHEVQRIMEDIVKIDVPLKVTMKIGETWGDCKEVKK